MSASDAAPLPRLGEVFFDVRGSSRSMRLSWYADTDVAVFSIWQGGMCTGTFRLPMGDLSRMIEILQRGPTGYAESGDGADYRDDYAGARDSAHAGADYGSGAYRPGDLGAAEYGPGEYGPGEYEPGRYGPDDYGEPGYADPAYRNDRYRDAGHPTESYRPGDYGPPDYEQAAGDPRPAYWHDEGRYQPDVTGQRSVLADEAGYGQERFVPPYVRSQQDSSQAGYLDDSEYRPAADPAARSRHSAGRHSSGQGQ